MNRLIKKSPILFVIILIVSCNVNTGTTNLADEYYLSMIFGQYRLSQAGVDILNNAYFNPAPVSPYTIHNIFCVDNYGLIGIYSEEDNVVFNFVYAIQDDTTSAIYRVKLPKVSDSGSLIQVNRYLKIMLDDSTNLIFSSQYTDTKEKAVDLTADYLFASPAY
ncbi:MAG: hypothetical protein ACRC0X_08230 [Brevinema sp.]